MCGLGGFIRRNIVVVLTLPVLGVIHVAWYKLQHNTDFVAEEERKVKFAGIDLSAFDLTKFASGKQEQPKE